jgi:hypothetical protein
MNRLLTFRPDWVRYFFVSLAAGLFMVSAQSLWIDEAETWSFARQPSFKAWLATLLSNTKSEAHTPLGMFALWVSGRLFGEGEWQLRALNILWIAIAGVAIGRLGAILGRRELLPFFLLHPFLWYYANEARAYALLICLSAWLLFLWTTVNESGTLSTGRLWAIGIVATLGIACSLLFGFALIGFGAALAATMLVQKISLERRHLMPITVTALAMVPVIAYYLWTLGRGASAAKIWSVSISNLAFAFYELLGFGGLGPPRHELRELAKSEGGLSGLMYQGRYLIGMALLAAAYLGLLRPLWKLRRDPLGMIAAGAMALSAGAMFVASLVVGFPLWGRHLAYLLPFIALLIARAAPQITSPLLRKSLIALLLVGLLASSLCQRFLPWYGKDDYRSASQMAKAAVAKGQTVWWVADPVLGEYYSLLEAGNKSGRVLWFNNAVAVRDMHNIAAPDLIFYSKPDIHDIEYQVGGYVKEHGYQPIAEFSAFSVYGRSGDQQ